jgi:hypothetical protein
MEQTVNQRKGKDDGHSGTVDYYTHNCNSLRYLVD